MCCVDAGGSGGRRRRRRRRRRRDGARKTKNPHGNVGNKHTSKAVDIAVQCWAGHQLAQTMQSTPVKIHAIRCL